MDAAPPPTKQESGRQPMGRGELIPGTWLYGPDADG